MGAVLAKGYVQVYTGNGKGKTTASIGAALRATSHGLRVAFVQFLKSDYDAEAIKTIPGITYCHFGLDHRHYGWCKKRENGEAAPEDIVKIVAQGWEFAKNIILAGEHDLVVLDELNVTLFFDLLPFDDVLATIKRKPLHVELIITGRQAPDAIRELANLVTEMHEEKHWYQQGVKARVGIEY